MTWQHFLRTLIITGFGAVALSFASYARAESGDGPSLFYPQESETAQSATNKEQEDIAPEVKAAEAVKSKKSLKAIAGNTAKKPPRVFERSNSDQVSTEAKEDGVQQTSALGMVQVDARPTSRQSDADRAGILKPLIAHYASENELPFELADAIVRLESRYNVRVRNGANLGLTQINFQTAQSLGYKGGAAGLLDAETNLRYGLKYLATAHKLAGGDTCGTILRYQFGHRAQTMTSASRRYCARVKTITATAE
jgi:soluble lytic murein transglycosylase-like protein